MNMEDRGERKQGLLVFTLFCFFLLIPSLLAWLVNVEVAVQALNAEWKALVFLIPARVFNTFQPLAVDLSTISTLVPFLLLVFPFTQGLRIILRTRKDPSALHEIEWLPYPPRFAFFLVMLGLTGTLYGLLIGIGISEVEDIIGHVPDSAVISSSLRQLLAGTATALLSSLFGLIGAFFAAEPIPWLFRRITQIEVTYESDTSLTETVETLTQNLHQLSAASRSFSARLKPKALDGLFNQLETLEASNRALSGNIDESNNRLERLEDVREQTKAILVSLQTLERSVAATGTLLDNSNERLKHMEEAQKETNALLHRLDTLENAFVSLGTKLDHSNDHLQHMKEEREQTNNLLKLLLKDNEAQHQSYLKAFGSILEASLENTRTAKHDREAVKRAFALYVQGLESGKTRE